MRHFSINASFLVRDEQGTPTVAIQQMTTGAPTYKKNGMGANRDRTFLVLE
jgi:hypothetical protein